MASVYTRRQHANKLIRELRKLGPARAMTQEKYWRGGELFCRRYFEECDAIVFHEPAAGLEWAEVAPYLASMVDVADERQRPELVAYAYGVEGSGYRAAGDFEAAERSYDEALKVANREGLSDSDRADIHRRLAVLRTDQKRYDEALGEADRAIEVFRSEESFQAQQDLAEALTVRGAVHLVSGDHAQSIRWFAEALTLADLATSRRTYHAAIHNIAYALARSACGDPEIIGKGYRFIREARRKLKNGHRSVPRAKLLWIESLLLAQTKPAPAVEGYLAARCDLIELEAAQEVCLISLDLGALYLRGERWSELLALAAETVQLAERLKVREEGIGALRLWTEAVQGEAVEAVLKAARGARQTIEG